MAVSKVDIINVALRRIKAPEIQSFNEDGKKGEAARRFYDESRRLLLGRGDWTFAKARERLSQSAETPAFEFDYAYFKPTAWLRTIAIYEDANIGVPTRRYKMEGDLILSNATELYMKFVRDETDTNKMSSLFRHALSKHLASEFALAIANSRTLHDVLLDEFERFDLPTALAAEAVQDGEDVEPADDWLAVRA